MPQFILLLHEGRNDFENLSPEDMQGVIEEYRAWSQSMAEQGKMVGGHKLADGEGRVLSGWEGDFSVTDGPHAEAKEVIGGFFHLRAEDYDEAVALSRTCPALKYDGVIELRRVDLVDD